MTYLGLRDKILTFFWGLRYFSPKSKCVLLYTSVRHFLKYAFKFEFSPRELKISVSGQAGKKRVSFFFKEFTGEIGMLPQIFMDNIYDLPPFDLDKVEGVIIDAGANIGMFSIKMAKRFPQARVYSIEPNPDAYRRLVRNIELNEAQNIVPCNMGVSDVAGSAFIDDRVSTVLGKITLAGEGLSRVPLTTIDSFIEKNRIDKIGLMKIDVEGYEYRAIKGLEANMGLVSRVVMECENALEEKITDFLGAKGLKKIKNISRFNVIYFSR